MILQQFIYWSIVIGLGVGLVLFADTKPARRLFIAIMRGRRG